MSTPAVSTTDAEAHRLRSGLMLGLGPMLGLDPILRFGLKLRFGLMLCAVLISSAAQARDLYESDDGEYRLELRSALKGSWLLSFPRSDLVLGAPDPNGAQLFRLRFDTTATVSSYLTAAVAYEHRAMASSAAGAGLGLLPSTARAPFRLRPLDRPIIDQPPGYIHRHELDRAYVALHLPLMELTVGRQAIGLGRGQLFSAVDVFAPFTPMEVDREWRRGVDAVHAEVRVPGLSVLSADMIVALDGMDANAWRKGAVLGRLRAIVGDLDGSLIVGRRGADNMVATVVSATLADAEAHAEYALYGTDGKGIDGGWFGTRSVVMKTLVGGSHVFDVGRGLRVSAEYHYSGFGVASVRDSTRILLSQDFIARFARGDSQLLGRHVVALVFGTDLSDTVSGAISYLQSPVDASGLVAPGLSWNHSDNLTLVASCFLAWGAASALGLPRSDWGASPPSVFLQARLYD